jgi:hypothetical protein
MISDSGGSAWVPDTWSVIKVQNEILSFRQVFLKLANVPQLRRPGSLRVPVLIWRFLTGVAEGGFCVIGLQGHVGAR